MSNNIVICCDGTWSGAARTYDRDAGATTNVVKIARMLPPDPPGGPEQSVHYLSGLARGRGMIRTFMARAFGFGLADAVRQACMTLANAYRPGDNIFLFGFSRGAWTARSLAGLIGLCGVPKHGGPRHARRAFSIYRSTDDDKQAQADKFYKHHAQPNSRKVRFIGVWDTVGALGIPPIPFLSWIPGLDARLKLIGTGSRAFHDITLGAHVECAVHALALDERRKAFAPTLWRKPPLKGQDVEQAWFAGSHSNIGGGYIDAGLSDAALVWVALKASQHGLALDADYLRRWVKPNAFGEIRGWERQARYPRDPAPRSVGLAANEAIHFTATRRMHDITAFYAPRNLLDAASQQTPTTKPLRVEISEGLYYDESRGELSD